jgi:NADH dehydrogenase
MHTEEPFLKNATITRAAPRVLILGGGQAGLAAARTLLRRQPAGIPLDVTVVSRDTSVVWNGLVSQVVSSTIQPTDAILPLRRALPGVTLHPHDVESIDLQRQRVTLNRGPDRAPVRLDYDFLVLALGSGTDLSRWPGVAEHAFGARTVGDAVRLRNHVIRTLDRASVEEDAAERRRLLTFVVAGSGFAGVEIAFELNVLVRGALRFFPAIDPDEERTVLVTRSKRILTALAPELADKALQRLRDAGMEVRLRAGLAAATATSAILTTGERISTRTLVAAVGQGANAIVESLPVAQQGGRIVCDRRGRVPGWQGVYAAGDAAAIATREDGPPAPATVTSARAQGRLAAYNILAELTGEAPRTLDATQRELALLGRGYGLVQWRGVRRAGFLPALAWHLAFLRAIPSWQRRVTLLLSWAVSGVFPRDISVVVLDGGAAAKPVAAPDPARDAQGSRDKVGSISGRGVD